MFLSFFRKPDQSLLRKQQRPQPRRRLPVRRLEVEWLERRDLLATWTPLSNLAPGGTGTMMLLSDGRVMVQGSGVTNTWFQLVPSATGSYINGSWSSLASMNLQRLYFGSNVLPSGKVFVVGGEYSGPSGAQNLTNTAEIYDPVANSWTSVATFPQSNFGDDPTEVLSNGQILAGYVFSALTYLYNPANNTWSATGTKLRSDRSDEEAWVLLPDGSVLSYDIFNSTSTGTNTAQRYVPSSGTWVDAGSFPAPLLTSSADGFELGPAFLLPDGRVFQLGANSNTALYTPSSNSWVAGPTIPNGKGADDAPGAVLPNGHVIFAADTPLFNGPTQLFDFDPVANTITQLTLPAALTNALSGASFVTRMLVLPNGDLLLTTSGNQLWEYTPNGGPNGSWQPTISSVTINADSSYTLTGTQLNGISEGAAYGDDAEMASNYPIVTLTSSGGAVYYAKTYNWTSQVATGSTAVTTQFTLPAGIPGGTYSLRAIANGIASAPVSFTVALQVTSSTPAASAVVTAPPTRFVVNFNEAANPSTLQPSALQVNGISANAVTLNGTAMAATFTYNTSPVTTQGLQTLAIAANTFLAADGTGNGAWSASLHYDTVTLGVASTNPPAGAFLTFSGSTATYNVTFNEPIDPATATTSNLTLNRGSVSGVTVLSGNQTVQYTITGLTSPGALTVTIPSGQLMDQFDNPAFTPFSATYQLNYGTVAYPVPIGGALPAGSLVYNNGTTTGTIGFAGDTNSFTVSIAAGQTITVLAAPAGTLQAAVALSDPSSMLLGSATSSQAGTKALLQTIATTSAGTYTITVTGANGTIGAYYLQVILNAALDTEDYNGTSNNTLATAQNIDSSFVSLGGTASRGAVLGQADLAGSALPIEIEPNNSLANANSAIGNFATYTGNLYQLGITGSLSSTDGTDFFNIGSLPAGAVITISEAGTSSSRGTLTDPLVELYRAGGPNRVTFDDDSGSGLDALVYRFTIPTTDIYYVRATRFGSSSGTYSLGLELEDNGTPPVIGGTFTTATEPNDTIATANDASSSWRPVQYQSSTNGTILSRSDTDFYQYQFTAGDLVTVNIHSTSTLNARVNLLNASGTIIASENGYSVGPGYDSLLYGVVIPSTGTYYVEVLAASGTGSYTANVYLSTTTPPPHASTSGDDYYAFTLAAGDTATLAIKALSSGSVNLTLLNASGMTVATGVTGPTNVNQVITDFTVPAGPGGTYYALVTGTAGTNYSLVVTRDAEFDTAPNNSFATAQPVNSLQVAGTQWVLGAIASGDAGDYYQITLAAGAMLQAQTSTPGGGSGQPVNTLNALLSLYYSASHTLVTSVSSNALLSYTVPAGKDGTYYVEVAPSSGTTGDYVVRLSGTSDPAAQGSDSGTGLYVTALTPTPNGFTASFSEAFVNSSASPIHLYDAASASYGPADVTLVGQNSGVVQGSLVIDPSNSSFTFVKTSGVLAPDTYTATFVSGAIGFQDASGAPLNGDGFNPGNYVTSFTVPASSAVVVSVPSFARGPDSSDPINVPNNSANGIPITVSDGGGVTGATLVLQYNADLLTISGGTVNASLPGASLTVTLSGSGSTAQATIVFQSATALPAGAVQLGGLTATVPSTAAYQAQELLHFSSLALNDGTIAAVGADGVQVVAFLGDTSGDGNYTGQDATLLSRVAAHADSGFAAYPQLDPLIIGDIDGNGIINNLDGIRLSQFLSGNAVAQIPIYPGPPSVGPTGADPSLSIPLNLQASPGGTVTVPVNIDDPRPAGSTGVTQAVLALHYDPAVLGVSAADIHLGSVPVSGTGWVLQAVVDSIDVGIAAPPWPFQLPAEPERAIALTGGRPDAGWPDGVAALFQAAVDAYFAQEMRGAGPDGLATADTDWTAR